MSQGSAKIEFVVEPASETTFRRRKHRIWRAAHFSQWIRRTPSQVTTSGTTRSSQKDRREGAHRGWQGKSLSISLPRAQTTKFRSTSENTRPWIFPTDRFHHGDNLYGHFSSARLTLPSLVTPHTRVSLYKITLEKLYTMYKWIIFQWIRRVENCKKKVLWKDRI